MDFLTDWLTNWLKELLIGGIMGNLEGLFDTVNTQVGEIAAQVGTTPAAWHAGVFSLIRQLSESVILPIAGMLLTFVATYELIQMLLEKNNMHEVDVANLYKWMFKTACAILILSNTFNIVMAVFDVSQSVIAQAGGRIQGSTDVSADMLAELETSLEAMDLGPLLGLWLQSALIGFTMKAMGIIIFVLVYGRMLEIYLLTSLAPIPVATLSNRELGSTGQNYIKSLFAVGFQGLLILVCVAIYAVLIQGIATGGDPIGAIWGTVGYTVLLCFMLFKTGSIAQRIPAYAYSDSGNEEPPVVEETPAPEPAPTITPGEGFSEDGNLVTRDLLYDAATNKQFITVETSGGNTFYIVIDYDKPVDEDGEQYHTYFLNMVDEADLLAALEAAGGELPACSCTEKCAPGAIHTDCEVCAVNMTECAGTAPEPAPVTEPAEEPEPEPQQKSNTGTLLLILAVAVLGGGAGWYFKIYRPKHEKAAVPEEDYSEELADYDDSEDDGPPWDEDDTESEDNE